jgi:arabinose-5-phosphate isomerase
LDYLQRARDIIDLESQGLQEVRNGLGASFNSAIEILLSCLAGRGKIVLTGVGKNVHVASKISATLSSTGATSVVLDPTQAVHGDLGILGEGDVLLALSYSGESEELLRLVPAIRRLNVKLIALTGSTDSALAKCSDAVIPVTVSREACPFNMAPTTSTTATLAVGDAIAMVLIEARGFGREDYAKLHPGGAIGRTLLLRVSDIMRTGERLATVRQGTRVQDAVLAMTSARSGSTGVVDPEGRLLGIFTDGDLRRHLAQGENILDRPVEDVMTRGPKTVRQDQLAIDVLRIFESHNIDDVLVVDSARHLVGSVDIQDLPKFKIL